MMKIHVVEDQSHHWPGAIAAIEGLGHSLCGEATFYNMVVNLKLIRRAAVEFRGEFGVLTDLYFPVDQWNNAMSWGEMAPLGLLIMAECQRLGVPCVIVTAGYHHGSKYNQACFAARTMDWPEIVDSSSSSSEEESEEKNWEEGVRRLEKLSAAMMNDGIENEDSC